MCNAFMPKKNEYMLPPEIQKIYDAVILKLKEEYIFVSPRIDKAIKCYWVVASKWFETDETKTEPEIVALDYAISQRILPKIIGNGELFRKWLEDLKSLCSNNGLNISAKILKDIINKGDRKMKYYEFFC